MRAQAALTGAAALAEALGVRLQFVGLGGSATPAGPGVREKVLDPRPRTWMILPVLRLVTLAAWPIGFGALVANAFWGPWFGVPVILAIGWTMMLAPVCWLAVSGLAAARRAWRPRDDARPPVADGAVLLRPEQAGPATRRFRTECGLIVGAREVAVRSAYGVEAWLPDPPAPASPRPCSPAGRAPRTSSSNWPGPTAAC